MNKEIGRSIYNEKTIANLDKKIKMLNSNTKIDAKSFLNIRLITSIVLFFILIYVMKYGYILGPTITGLYYYFFDKVLIDRKLAKRTSKLESEAMHFFEVLTLSLETGRNLDEAIKVTINSVDGELTHEFMEAIREVNFGKSLTESLNDMQSRIPSEAINNIILSLTEADMFGNRIIKTMYNQVDYLREKKRLEVKAEISKIPIKISVISVLFFIPLILLIILGPVILTYLGL